jgi:hypothetical protein
LVSASSADFLKLKKKTFFDMFLTVDSRQNFRAFYTQIIGLLKWPKTLFCPQNFLKVSEIPRKSVKIIVCSKNHAVLKNNNNYLSVY